MITSSAKFLGYDYDIISTQKSVLAFRRFVLK